MGLQHPCPVPGKGQDVPAHSGRWEVTFSALPACTYAWALGEEQPAEISMGEKAIPEVLRLPDPQIAVPEQLKSQLQQYMNKTHKESIEKTQV